LTNQLKVQSNANSTLFETNFNENQLPYKSIRNHIMLDLSEDQDRTSVFKCPNNITFSPESVHPDGSWNTKVFYNLNYFIYVYYAHELKN
jgi:hypothetical protein